jgi:hypothetical protein
MPPTPPINKTMSPLEWGLLGLLSVLWGGSFFFNGVAVRELPALTIVVVRVGLTALCLLAVMRMLGQTLPASGRVWAAFFAMGFLNNVVPFSLIVWGQTHIASGVASILQRDHAPVHGARRPRPHRRRENNRRPVRSRRPASCCFRSC